jgi:hypothetical protein
MRAGLSKGKRMAMRDLVIAVIAVALAVVASRTVDDGRLVTVYLLARAPLRRRAPVGRRKLHAPDPWTNWLSDP